MILNENHPKAAQGKQALFCAGALPPWLLTLTATLGVLGWFGPLYRIANGG